MTIRYAVIEARDGCDEVYIDSCSTLREARRIAAQYGRGERSGTPRSLYDTARAAHSDVPGCSAPPAGDIGEAMEWRGRDGYVAICPIGIEAES